LTPTLSKAHASTAPVCLVSDGADPQFLSAKSVSSLIFFSLGFGAVIWQCRRVGVLWDFSYVMNTAYRISRGDIPYKDFSIPHAPLSFVMQAGIIRLFGSHFYNAELFAALLNGFTMVLTFWLMASIVPPRLAFLCAVPLVFLAGYSILPIPFYDSDCCFFVVLALFCVHRAEARGFPALWSVFSGILLVVPIFVKQNVGLLFFVLSHVVLVLMLALNGFRRGQRLGYLTIALGSAGALLVALAILHATSGVSTYVYWTYSVAKAKRLPPLASELVLYMEWTPWLWVLFLLGGGLLFTRPGKLSRWVGAFFCAVPFIWAAWLTIRLRNEPYATSGTLLDLWPALLVLSVLWFLLDLVRARENLTFLTMLPLVIVGIAHASFLSQGLWGSTFGIWPLFVLMLAITARHLTSKSSLRSATVLVGLLAFFLTVAGFSYFHGNRRLQFADVDDGSLDRFRSGPLKGLSARGPFVGNLQELLDFAVGHIPSSEGVLLFPGEDPFFFATGRKPAFPVVSFDDTLNPYDVQQLLDVAKAKNIAWIVVKRKLQLRAMPMADYVHLMQLVKADYVLAAQLRAYDVYRREAQDASAGLP
jgi:hypothetical protein